MMFEWDESNAVTDCKKARVGVILEEADDLEKIKVKVATGNHDTNPAFKADVPKVLERSRSALRYALLVQMDDEAIVFPYGYGTVFLDEDGRMVRSPVGSIDKKISMNREADATHFVWKQIYTAMLAVVFMTCKNVTVERHHPDKKLNRARAKAGLKPFLRYHTIEIEPMRRALATEGNIARNGIAKALHLVRGHMAILTKNNKGEPLQRPTVYWRDSHVRGSAERGVVLADYAIGSPPPGVTPGDLSRGLELEEYRP
jgi:hypothetical protein